MKIGRLFPDLLATLGRAASPEAGFARTLRHLVKDSGATAGALLFAPGGAPAVRVTAGARRGSALETWLVERVGEPVHGLALRGLRGRPPAGGVASAPACSAPPWARPPLRWAASSSWARPVRGGYTATACRPASRAISAWPWRRPGACISGRGGSRWSTR